MLKINCSLLFIPIHCLIPFRCLIPLLLPFIQQHTSQLILLIINHFNPNPLNQREDQKIFLVLLIQISNHL